MKKFLSEVFHHREAWRAARLKALQFPRIYRLFPAFGSIRRLVLSRVFLISFVCGFTLMATAIAVMQLRENYYALQRAEQVRLQQRSQLRYWEQIVATRPDYRDAYYKLAAIQLSLGDKKNAGKTIEKALQIDPKFTAGNSLKQEIQELF